MFTKKKIFDQLTAAALKQPGEIILVSPFLSLGTLKDILDKAPNSKITLVTKDDAYDCASGYNDVNAWKEVWRLGGQVYFCEKLHAKYYRFDNDVFVGSANLTDAGVGTSATPNFEILTPVNYDDEVKAVEKDLFSQSVCVEPHDPLVAKFEDVVNQLKVEVKKVRDVEKDALKQVKTFHFASTILPISEKERKDITFTQTEALLPKNSIDLSQPISRFENCSAVNEIINTVISSGYLFIKDNKYATNFQTPSGKPFAFDWTTTGLKRNSSEDSCRSLPYCLALHPTYVTPDNVTALFPSFEGYNHCNSNLKEFPPDPKAKSQTKHGTIIKILDKAQLFEILQKYDNLK